MVGKWFRRRNHRNTTNTINTTNSKKFNVRFFSFNTLRIASNDFSTCIGEGGCGRVFKGILPDDGRSIAIKRLYKPYRARFLETVEFMSHLQHINLIQVIGCCIENDEQILVCEFAENGTISPILHSKRSSSLDWKRRSAVCIGTARAISYLHNDINPQVIHCDIKPLNILLDANFNPKITDFDLIDYVDRSEKSSVRGTGKGEIGSGDENSIIKGTIGYLDPEYYFTGRLTQKVDVYSFGLVMLEIITGRRVVDLESDDRWILRWVKKMKKDGKIFEMVDPNLTDFPKEEVERFINVALLCTQTNSERRPSMFEVVYMLYGGHKSDQEISDMAIEAIVAQPERCLSDCSTQSFDVAVSVQSLSISTSGKSDVTDDKCCTKTAGEVAETSSRSRSKEEDFVAAYFERSMEKIMRYQVSVHKVSEHVSMEAVYPPFLSGEYRRSSLF